MNKLTLIKANNLHNLIKEYENALYCFEAKYGDDNQFTFDRTPKIILNVDNMDDGREDIAIPMNLSDELVNLLKSEIQKNLEIAKKEFEDL